MDKNQIIKITLMFVFFAVLIAGIPITVKNYNRWSSVSTSVVREYRKPLQNGENAGDIKNVMTSDDLSESDSNTADNSKGAGTDQITDGSQGSGDDQTSNGLQETDTENGTGSSNTTESEKNSTTDLQSGDSGLNVDGSQNPENSQNAENSENRDESRDPDDSSVDNGESENDSANIDNNSGNDDTKIAGKGNMEGFYISTISDDIFSRIKGRSYPEDCPVSRDELRYVHIRHYGFEGEIRDGELIVNAAIAEDVMEIFEELYDIKYQIEKVRLIDEYDADDERSMEDNNSSCFNYRTIAESSTLSNHAYGRAIDINPFYNPYVYTRSDGSLVWQPKGSDKYVDRIVDAACIIRSGDACYNIFVKHGFTWGGDWNTKKDYQHFEKTE